MILSSEFRLERVKLNVLFTNVALNDQLFALQRCCFYCHMWQTLPHP